MMLVTPDLVLRHTLVDDQDLAIKVVKFAPQAEQAMISKLGSKADYDRVVGYDGSSNASEQSKYDRLEQAETLWAFAESLSMLNLRITDGGGVVSSTGFDQNRTDFLSAAQLDDHKTALKAQAEGLIQDLTERSDDIPWIC